ncbi:MAG TPA: antibiotic biosynthesis monooxygenase [Roseiflexaceae bacterium]|nr:antibiotic biosynthesis monooxygenase [Roseiflexaceae bacterium]
MPIYQTAQFEVRPEALERCEQAIREFVAYIQANEPGTLLYTSVHAAGDPASFLHFFIFEDEAARERHRTSEAVRRFTDTLYPELLAPVEFQEYSAVATTAL